MATFTFHNADFGDSDHPDYGDSVWVAAFVDGDETKGIGAYVTRDGSVSLDDHIAWRVQNDLAAMGVDPESSEADALLREWSKAAQDYGIAQFQKIA